MPFTAVELLSYSNVQLSGAGTLSEDLYRRQRSWTGEMITNSTDGDNRNSTNGRGLLSLFLPHKSESGVTRASFLFETSYNHGK